jgi:redox-sensitive bicupin YhaK (pirin superfamily)
VASADGRDGSVLIHQNASVHAGLFDGDEAATLNVAAGRRIYVHVARGSVQVDGQRLDAGDAAKVSDQTSIRIDAGVQSEVLVFDLP